MEKQPQHITFSLGLEFIERNKDVKQTKKTEIRKTETKKLRTTHRADQPKHQKTQQTKLNKV